MVERGSAPAETPHLVDAFQGLLIAGRWLLVVGETAGLLLLLPLRELDQSALAALAALTAYNVATLILAHRVSIRRLPVPLLLALDSLFLALAALPTGGARSPFLGQYYLIVLAAALLYGLPGGLLVGSAAALVTAVIAAVGPPDAWLALRNLAAYLVLVGGFTGYLSSRLRTWFRRYHDSQEELHAGSMREEITRRELELARAIQRSSLPAAPPEIPGLDLAVRMEFAGQVGGDFYMFLEERRRVGLIVGDVSGKGIPAALVSTAITHLLPLLAPAAGPERALRVLDRDLEARLPPDSFVSMVLAILDTRTGGLQVWSAGHLPALIWRAASRRLEQSRESNRLLGIFADGGEFLGESWHLAPGDLLLLYTDGLVEPRGAAGNEFGLEGIEGVLSALENGSAAQTADALVRAAREWGGLTDDVTILVCRRVGRNGTVRGGAG